MKMDKFFYECLDVYGQMLHLKFLLLVYCNIEGGYPSLFCIYTYSVKLIKACICYQKVNIGLPKCLITDTWFSYLDFYSYGKDIDYHVHFRQKNLEITHQKFWKQEKINWNSTYRLLLNSVRKATYHCLKFYWISSKSQFMSQKLLLSVQIVDLMIELKLPHIVP